MRDGIFAEFETADAVASALEAMRVRGYAQLETFTPFEVPDVGEGVIGAEGSWLARAVFVAGLVGAAAGYLVQWYTNAVDYPLNAGGRPTHAAPAFVFITFEVMALLAGLAAFVGFLVATRLPELWHPAFEIDGFERASSDRYWLAVSADDPRFDLRATADLLESLGALEVVPLGEVT